MDDADGTPLIDALAIRVHRSPGAARGDLDAPGLAGYAFGRFAWLEAWHATLGAGAATEVAIVVVADDRVRMVLPLGVSRARGLRVLEFLGAPVTDYNAPLVDPAFAAALDAAGMERLWARIGAALPRHDVVRLRGMPEFIDAQEGAGAAPVPNPLAGLRGAAAAGGAQSRRLPASYAALNASLKGKFASNTRRLRRRLEEIGPVTLTVARSPAEMDAVLAALKRMKSRRWVETGAKDWFSDPDFAAFYAAMGRLRLPEGGVHGTLLAVGGTPVAAHLGLVYRDRFYFLLFGWEGEAWRSHGTGRLMVDALMRCTIEERLAVFDFTGGDETYKRDWSDAGLTLFQLERATTRLGALAVAGTAARRRVRERAKRVGWLRGAVRRLAGRPSIKPDARKD